MEGRKYFRPSKGWISHGYRNILISDGKAVKEHRWIMENLLGRPLLPNEHIHHKNGITTDNSPDNLEIVSPSKHARIHHCMEPLISKCTVCGNEFTQVRRGKTLTKTCSKECRYSLSGNSVSLTRKTKYWINKGTKRRAS